MSRKSNPHRRSGEVERPWDARLARSMVTPLAHTWVHPNHLTTLRLAVGLAAAVAFTRGTYLASNVGALLWVLSSVLDHADGELARMTGTSSRFGHLYDLASDAAVTVLLFIAIGIGAGAQIATPLGLAPAALGAIAGIAVALIFTVRLRVEELMGKSATRQALIAGFQTEDVLYLLPLVTLCGVLAPFLLAASLGAPLFAMWVLIDYWRVMRRRRIAVHSVS